MTPLFWLYRELMDGEDGRLSFGKHMAAGVFTVFACGGQMPAVIAIALLLVAHGIKYLTAWLKLRPFSATEAVATVQSTVRSIVERRDEKDGVEPTQ